MRFRLADPGSQNYLCVEAFLNNLQLIPVNSDTELVLGVAIVDGDGNQVLIPSVGTTAAVTSVSDSDSSQTLLAASSSRKSFKIFNNSTAICYVKYGATATSADFTVRLNPYGLLEENGYSGRVDAIWASNASGAALVTSIS